MSISLGRTISINCEVCFVVFFHSPCLLAELGSSTSTCPEQSLTLVVNDFVAFASDRFEALAVNDPNVAAGIADQARILEMACSHGDTLATSPQHVGDEFLCQQQFVGF